MKKFKIIKSVSLVISLFLALGSQYAPAASQIQEFNVIRTSMGDIGNEMPEMIKKAKGTDARILERIFEINTYTLTTIEAYFKMLRISISSEGRINMETIDVLNGWLRFISKYSEEDMVYLDHALAETKDASVTSIIARTKDNIRLLQKTAGLAIAENNSYLKNQ